MRLGPRHRRPGCRARCAAPGRPRRRWPAAGGGGGRSGPPAGSRGTAAPWSRSTSRRRPCRRRGRHDLGDRRGVVALLGEALGGERHELRRGAPCRAGSAVVPRRRTVRRLDRTVKNGRLGGVSRTRATRRNTGSHALRRFLAHGDLRRPHVAARPSRCAGPGRQPDRRGAGRHRRHRHPRARRRPGHRRAGRRPARRGRCWTSSSHEIQQVDGVDVEEVRPVADALHDPRLDALETAAILVGATDRDELVRAVVEHARRAVGAEWSAVVQLEDGAVAGRGGPGPRRAVAGRLRGGEPVLGAGRRRRDRARRRRLVTACRRPGLALVVGRDGTAYRARERRQVAALARSSTPACGRSSATRSFATTRPPPAERGPRCRTSPPPAAAGSPPPSPSRPPAASAWPPGASPSVASRRGGRRLASDVQLDDLIAVDQPGRRDLVLRAEDALAGASTRSRPSSSIGVGGEAEPPTTRPSTARSRARRGGAPRPGR